MDPNEYDPPRQRKKPKVKESIIDHTYRDYSQVEVSDDEDAANIDVDKKSSRLQPNFPAKLHAIVSNPNYQHIICWQVSFVLLLGVFMAATPRRADPSRVSA